MAVEFKVECAFGHTFSESHMIRNNQIASPEPASGDAVQWFGNNAGGAYTVDYVTTGLPPLIRSGQRRTWTADATTNSGGIGVWLLDDGSGMAGKTYRGRLFIRCSVDQVMQPYFQAYDAAQSVKVGEINLPTVSCKAWEWTEIVTPAFTAPAGTGSLRILAYQSAATVDGITGHNWLTGEHVTGTGAHVELATTFGPYIKGQLYGPGPDTGWTDISDYANGFNSGRGRNDEFDAIEAGTLNLSLDNADGRFTPQRASSPYYPNVKPMTPIRVTASTDGWASSSPVFTGVIEKWPVKLDTLSSCDVTAVDLFGVLGRSKLRAPLRKRWQDQGCTRLFPLNADSGFSDVMSNGRDAVKFGGSSGTAPITYDGTPFYRGDGYGVGMTVGATVSTIGAGASFTYADHSRGGAVVFMWQPDQRITVANGDAQTLLNVRFPDSDGGVGHDVIVEARWDGAQFSIYTQVLVQGYGTSGSVPIQFGKSYLFVIYWTEQNFGGGTGYTYFTNVYDTATGNLLGTTSDDRRIYALANYMDAYVYAGGRRDGTNMASGQFANLACFEDGTSVSGSTLLEGVTNWPVSGWPSESDEMNEVLQQAGYDYLATLSWPTVALAPLDWQDRKSVLEVLQSCGADANGLVFPRSDGTVGYWPGAQRFRLLRGAPLTLTDTDDFEPGVSLYVDDQNIVNDVTLEFAGGGGLDPASSNAVSPTSVAVYETATLSQTSNLVTESVRRDLAAWIAYTRGEGGIRIESVTFPLATASNPAALLGIEIGARIKLAFPDTAPFSTCEFFVEGIEVEASAEGASADSSITFRLSMCKAQSGWVLQDPIYGVLDDTTRPFA